MLDRIKLLLALIVVPLLAYSQANTTVGVVVNDDTRIVLRRTTYYNEFLPDTSLITNRRAEINRLKLLLVDEWRQLDTLRADWETAKGGGAESIGEPEQITIAPAPPEKQAPAFVEVSPLVWNFGNTRFFSLEKNGVVWVNGKRYKWSTSKKQWILQK